MASNISPEQKKAKARAYREKWILSHVNYFKDYYRAHYKPKPKEVIKYKIAKLNPNNIVLIVKYGFRHINKAHSCINCGREFILNEEIVSKQANHKRAYYCIECAKEKYII